MVITYIHICCFNFITVALLETISSLAIKVIAGVCVWGGDFVPSDSGSVAAAK